MYNVGSKMAFSAFRQRVSTTTRWFTHPANTQQRNVRNVLIDGIGVGIVNGVVTFLSVFLVRLGASPFLVGLLTSMPAFTGMLLSLSIGGFLERQRNIVPWYSRSRVLVLSSYALIGLVPFVFSDEASSIPIITIAALTTVPQTIVNVAFTVVMSAVAGPHQRYYLMSRRWSVLGVTSAITVSLIGLLLDRISFPLNYQLVFVGSFLGGMLSFAFSSRIAIPDNDLSAVHERQTFRERIREGIQGLRENPPFSRFLASQFVFRCGITMAIPLFPLYWVRDLNASDTWIGVINTANSAVLLVAYFIWATLSQRRGAGLVLRVCGFGLSLYPLLTALTTSTLPLPLYAGLGGLFNAGVDLVLFDILLLTCPPRHTASYIALYQFTTYVATLVAPTIGTMLSDWIGLSGALLVSAALRFVGAALFVALGVGAVSTPPAHATEAAKG